MLLEHYRHDLLIYSSAPYGCDIPDVAHLPPTEVHLPFNHSPKMVIQDFHLSQKVGILSELLHNRASFLLGCADRLMVVGVLINLYWIILYVLL
jgi:hypothetical protein